MVRIFLKTLQILWVKWVGNILEKENWLPEFSPFPTMFFKVFFFFFPRVDKSQKLVVTG